MVVMLLLDLYKVINAFSSGSSVAQDESMAFTGKEEIRESGFKCLSPLNPIRAS